MTTLAATAADGGARPRRDGRPRLSLLAAAIGGLVSLVGFAYLAAWLSGSMTVRGLEAVTMKTNAAACLAACGAALTLLVVGGRIAGWTARALAVLALLIGGLTLVENISGWNLGIDQLLAHEAAGAQGVISPNRMGTPASTSFLLTGLALLALSGRRRPALGQGLALAVCVIAFLSSLGYLYSVQWLYNVVPLTAIAWPTATTLLVLGGGLLCARPREGLVAQVTADDPGGAVIRRLLLPIVTVPVAAGWLRLTGERRGWFDPALGTALVMLFFMVLFSALAYLGGREVSRRAAALRDRETQHRRLVENLQTAVLVLARDGVIRLANHRAAELLGLSLDQLRDQARLPPSWTLLREDGTPLPQEQYPFEQVIASGRPLVNRVVGLRLQQGPVWLLVNAFPDFDEAGEVTRVTLTFADISGRRRFEEELAQAKLAAERAQAAAEEANRAKDHFIAVLSHELRTPLTPVLAGLSLLDREPAISDSGRHFVEVIRRNVELESRLIDDLLDLTRIARGKVELHRQRVELSLVIDRAVEVCRPDIEARRLEFAVDFGPRPYFVDADAARLQQVFWNLLKNAIKFTPQGGRLGVRCRRLEQRALVEVEDSGIGIEPADLQGIFDAFVQARRSMTRRFGGLGLGLAISKALVELHGGTIEAHSHGPGRGSVFRVSLPTVPAPAATAARASAAATAAAGLPLALLLVEDHGDTAEAMMTVLSLEGHEVERAADVASALLAASRRDFDVVVSDLGLPDRSGLELMREMRARGQSVPGIAVSGYGQEHDLEQSRAAGFALHLVKPVEPQRLLDAVRAVARRQ
jgi:PAS domain S-box-containing protein